MRIAKEALTFDDIRSGLLQLQHGIGELEQSLPGTAVTDPGTLVTAQLVILRETGAQQRQLQTPRDFHGV